MAALEATADQPGAKASSEAATALGAADPGDDADTHDRLGAQGVHPMAAGLPARSRQAGHQELLLSTFMLLTAFFAVLVSLSQFEPERTQLVLNSIAQVFAIEISSSDEQPFSNAEEQASFAASAEKLRRLLERSLAITAAVPDQSGDHFGVSFAAARLFKSGSAEIKNQRQVMLGRMAQQLAAGTPSPRPTVFVAADASEAMALALARLETVQRRLEQLGADPDRVILGLSNAGDRQWRFEFRYDG